MKKCSRLILLLVFSISCNLSGLLPGGGNKNSGGNNNPTSEMALTALINEINGPVQVKQPDQSAFTEAGKGLTLQVQGAVKTGDNGRARLDLSSGTIVRVAPASIFTLTDNRAASNSLTTKIRLEAGKLWIVLTGGELNLDTPSGQAGVRGSYLSVAIEPGTFAVYVTCLEGNCSVTNPAGQLDLTDGQTGRLLPTDPATNVYVAPQLGQMTPQDFQDWKDNVPEAANLIPSVSATVVASAPTPAADVPCLITLSGAVSKSLTCTVQFYYSTVDGNSGLRIVSDSQITDIATFPEAQFVAVIPGALQPGTYTTGDQAASVFEAATEAWLCDTQNGAGSSSVTFTSIDITLTNAQGNTYLAHGTVTANLEAQVAGSGPVQMTITF